MSKPNTYLFLLLILFVMACVPKPEVRFMEPQPKNKRDLKIIPKVYQGHYLSKSDSSVLTIDSKGIFQEWMGIAKVSRAEMQNEFDTIYTEDAELALSEKWTLKVEIEGDSATITTYGRDTLFSLNEKTKLRSFKGYLFLNYEHPDSTWRVKTLKLERDQLDFEELVNYMEIDSLRNITPIVTLMDTATNRPIHHDLNPKRGELKTILKRKVPDSQFIRMN